MFLLTESVNVCSWVVCPVRVNIGPGNSVLLVCVVPSTSKENYVKFVCKCLNSP